MPATTTYKDIIWNLMSAVYATATATAGSTPSTTNSSNNSLATANNMVTTVLANSQDGGWVTATGNAFTAGTVPASSTADYFLRLQTTDGKGGNKIFSMGAGNTNWAYYRANNTSIASYNKTWTSMDVLTTPFNAGTYQVGYGGTTFGSAGSTPGPLAVTGMGSWMTEINPTSALAQSQYGPFSVYSWPSTAGTIFYVGATSDYITLLSPYGIWYFGTRTSQGWEQSYSDNPYLVGFGYHPGMQMNNGATNNHHTPFSAMYTRTINTDTVSYSVNSPYMYYNTSNATTSPYYGFNTPSLASTATTNQTTDPISLKTGATVPLGSYPTTSVSTNTLRELFRRNSWEASGLFDGPSVDSGTGLLVPTVYPINFSVSGSSTTAGGTQGGTAIGIYKGQNGINANSPLLSLPSYNINGSNYAPIWVGTPGGANSDLFFVKLV
jgi:hypothetical protein